MDKPKREIVLLVGMQGSGKSRYLRDNAEHFKGFTIISLDDLIEQRARQIHMETELPFALTLVWDNKHEIDALRDQCEKRFREALARGDNIVVDALNANPDLRQKRVGPAKESPDYDYKATAIVIHAPEEPEHMDRLCDRGMKTGHWAITRRMPQGLVSIQEDEGFDTVTEVGEPPRKRIFQDLINPTVPTMLEIVKARGKASGDKQKTELYF